MNPNLTTRFALAVTALLTLSAGGMLAQTTSTGSPASIPPTTPVAAATTPEEEEIIELSPFEVSSVRDTGYVATETLAGTRIRTDLRDVGSAISVITKEMLTDIGATDNGTLLQYTTNTEVGLTRGTYAGLENAGTVNEGTTLVSRNSANRVRGLSAADNTRDFFVTDIPWDSYNVDRIDLQRGPNAMLFGLGKPAGIINASLRNAAFKNSGEVQARFGSYGSWRTSLDYNQQLVDGVLAFRVAALKDDEKFKQDPAFEDDERLYMAIRFDPKLFGDSARTSIKAKYEHGEIDANRPRTVTPMDAVSAWFRPLPTERRTNGQYQWTLANGMGKSTFANPYDVFATEMSSGNANFIPWLNGGPLNAQQPFWLIDGGTAQVYDIRSGVINNGARTTTGAVRGTSDGILGRNYATPFLGINTLNRAATNLALPNANYGQYRANSMLDPTIFDFYNQLIDGDTKGEFEKWEAFNLDLSQTLLNDRLGVQLSYDRQTYIRGGESFLGWQPTIEVDVLQRWDDLAANPNVGRPFVVSGGGGSGNSYDSSREYYRASLFGELRATDVFKKEGFLTKLLGKHRLNAVYSDEDYLVENRNWQRKAFDTAWASYWTSTNGLTTPIDDRNPVGIIYLGDSLSSLSTASGANIPRVTGNVELTNGNAYLFDSIWTAPSSVAFNAPWNVPTNLNPVYNGAPKINPATGLPYAQLTQSSNPDNYRGYNRNTSLNLWSYDDGADPRLLTRRQLAQRQTTSKALSWQSYWWDGAVVGTWGWREDELENLYWGYNQNGANRKILAADPTYIPLRTESAQTTSGGLVVHVNRFFRNDDWLPLNVSFSYNKSSNFDVAGIRNDLYGRQIANPSGDTEDYGVLLATKDGKYSLRAIKYEASVKNDNAGLDAGFGGVVSNGLNWRNVFLYKLGAYDWSGRETESYRNNAANAYPESGTGPWGVAHSPLTPIGGTPAAPSPAEMALEDAMITQWNQIQSWLAAKGFFQAWGFTPVPNANLTNRSTYYASIPKDANGAPTSRDPAAQYIPPSGTLYAYTATAPQNFAVTADTLSKGYEFEFTANPLNNWRISINAAKTEAFKNNVGGADMQEFVDYMNSMLIDTAGTAHGPGRTSNGYTAAGNVPRWGGAGNAIGPTIWAPWMANYNRLKLNEGTAVPELRKWRFNFVTNYQFRTGFLKNVGVGGSYRWQDKVVIGYPLIPNGAAYNFDIENPIHGPSEDFIDLWASYERRLADKIRWKIQLNVRNAFADNGLIPISVQPDNSTWASVRVKPVQEWFVTNTFSF